MKSHQTLADELSEEIQRSGTLTVLHTNAVAIKVGLSATEFEAFDVIRRMQPVTAGKLSLYCGLTTGAITGIIDRLERAHCVRRVSDPTDRRRVLLEPLVNRDMMEKVERSYQPIHDEFHAIVAGYTPEQIEFLIETFKVMNNMTEKVITRIRDN
jgi:DNA-binding MarR family transcriptional regulator